MQYTTQTKSLPPQQFLTISGNLLRKSLVLASRTEAKRIFREIEAGKTVPLTYLELEDKSLVRFDLSLDHKMYRGSFTFKAFRDSVGLLVLNIGEALTEQESIRIFQEENNPRSMVFGVFAITVEEDQPSILSLVIDSSAGDASVELKLTYLDSVQFQQQAGDGSGESASDTA
ncbi:MAG: hypothetical protein V2I82_14480 [Halieaceae bacterium]|jgi:hypothetical protein|nr:hypothetical protein [Halieaceae bacterium]